MAARKTRKRPTTNVTLKIDSELLRDIRVLAAQKGTSISGMLAATLEQMVRDSKNYDAAMRRAIARMREGFNLGYQPSSRDELHER